MVEVEVLRLHKANPEILVFEMGTVVDPACRAPPDFNTFPTYSAIAVKQREPFVDPIEVWVEGR